MTAHNDRRTNEVLAAHAEALIGHQEAMEQVHVTDSERAQLASLFDLAEHLQESMPPVRPPSGFVHSLSRELSRSAQHQIAAARRLRRGILIAAATVGSLISIASIVGAIILLISHLRSRSRASTSSTN
jgi:hypothetical protein